MTKIIGISGSLREKSYNTFLLQAIRKQADRIFDMTLHSIKDIPLYNQDIEEDTGIPGSVLELKEKISNSQGIIIATPEYNHSMPGVLKNTIDWLSRTDDNGNQVLYGKCNGLVGATPGDFGTILGQNAWLPIFRVLSMNLYTEHSLKISHANKIFDNQGNISDETTAENITKFVKGFNEFVCQMRNNDKH